MTEPYILLSETLGIIESKISERLSVPELSGMVYLSPSHLQRLFKFAFGIPLAGYMRSRKLSVSALKLMTTGLSVINIAGEHVRPVPLYRPAPLLRHNRRHRPRNV